MYTNAGMLAMMTTRNIAANYEIIREALSKAESGQTPMSEVVYDDYKRWEEDIHDHFVRQAEQLGYTNVRNSSMKF